MHLHRRLGDHQLARDDLVRCTLGQRAQDHYFAARQALDRGGGRR
jgi:hypothetical protein